jgi:putative oligomerization/nucleic acid binding protein
MVVIFGFGEGKHEDLGEVAPAVCPNCHNQVFIHHVRSKKSVRLYFVPVVPYGTNDYLVCPICSWGLQVSQAQLPSVRSMTSTVASFRAGRLAEGPYLAQVERFWRQLGVSPAGQQVVSAAGPAPAQPVPAPQPPPRMAQPPPMAPPRATSAPPPPAAAQPPPAAAQPPPAAADDETSWLSQLQKLARLHDQGVLSDDDYEAAKRRVLGHK